VAELPSDRHWCAVETERLPEIVRVKSQAFWQEVERVGLLDLWRRSERTYYGLDESGLWKESAAVTFGGNDDELVLPRVNHYRSILQGVLAMVVQERPAFQAKSVNDQTRSLMEAPIATGLIEAYWRKTGLERLTQDDVEHAIVYGEGYQHLRWNIHAGRVVGQGEMGERVHEGDVDPISVAPWCVVHDLAAKKDSLEWAIVAHHENAWEVAARYPSLGQAILNQRGRGETYWPDNVWRSINEVPDQGEDRVTVWCLYHLPTDAVPDGRYAIVCGDVVLYDGKAIMQDEIPVLPLVPARQMGRGWGHSALWDLLPLQELYDAAQSNIATMHDAFGTYNILVPKGTGISEEDLGSGRRFVPFQPIPGAPDMGRPQPLQLMDISNDVYEYPDKIKGEMQTISGLNSVARGEPDSNLKSGAALALVQSLAVQFNSALQGARVRHLERVAHCLLKLLKANMVGQRIAEVSGAGTGMYLRAVEKGDIESVERVIIDISSPLMSQPAGRLDVANTLLDRQLIKTPEQYLQVLNSGRLDPMTRATIAALDHIAQENDTLREGRPLGPPAPPAPPSPPGQPPPDMGPGLGVEDTDDHATHVREHAALLDAATRADPKKLQIIREHIAEHYRRWSMMPPDMGALLGQSVPPPAPIPMGPPAGAPPGGPPPSDGAPAGGPPPPPDEPAPERASPLGGEPTGDMPFMPKNPLTGERAQV
jgi:hypothetical protein